MLPVGKTAQYSDSASLTLNMCMWAFSENEYGETVPWNERSILLFFHGSTKWDGFWSAPGQQYTVGNERNGFPLLFSKVCQFLIQRCRKFSKKSPLPLWRQSKGIQDFLSANVGICIGISYTFPSEQHVCVYSKENQTCNRNFENSEGWSPYYSLSSHFYLNSDGWNCPFNVYFNCMIGRWWMLFREILPR